MNNFEFSQHFAEHLEIGLLYLMICLLINLSVLRRYIYSAFDPLFFYSVLAAAGGSVVLYLYHFDLIRPFYFWSYVATQIAFTSGFLLIRPPYAAKLPKPTLQPIYSDPIRTLYPLSVLLYIAVQLIVYMVVGLPILLESRLETFASGGGFGLLSRVIFVTSQISLVIATYRLLLLKIKPVGRAVDLLVVLFCIVVATISGSKGAMLSIIFTMSLSLFYARRFCDTNGAEIRLRKFFFILIGLSLPVAFGTIYLQAGMDNLLELASVVAMRFVLAGDIFYMVYPNDVLQFLHDGNGLLALFYSPLGSIRLVPREELPINLGLQAFWYHYDTSLLSGPNARHNVFGLHYFGAFFSVIFSLILGLLFSFSRNWCYKHLSPSPGGMITYVLIVNCALFIEQDVSGQAIEYFFSVALIYPVLYLMSSIINIHSRQHAQRSDSHVSLKP